MYVISTGICIDIQRLRIFVYVVYGSGKAVSMKGVAVVVKYSSYLKWMTIVVFIYILYSTRRYK